MAEEKFQIRLKLSEDFAFAVNAEIEQDALEPLFDVLDAYDADICSQLDAFESYLSSPEAHLPENAEMCDFTLKTVKDPAKRKKYSEIFVLSVRGKELFSMDESTAQLLADLDALKRQGVIEQVQKIPVRPFHPRQVNG